MPLIPDDYIHGRLTESHRRDLLRQAEQERLLAQLPAHRGSASRYIAGKLGVLLLRLGTRLKQFEQKSPTLLEHHP